MNRLEFNTVLDNLKIEKIRTTDYVTYRDDTYSFKDLNITFSGSYYSIIEGKIPLEVANIIYEKYPNNPYKIRVAGGCEDWNPKDWATGDYLYSYHIDTKEGLLIFMLEIFDYYARKNSLPEIYVNQYQNYLNIISKEVIKAINPNISLDEWMKGAVNFKGCEKDSYLLYLEAINSEVDDIDKKIREALIKFDEAVNPFQSENINFLTKDIFEKIEISGCTFSQSNGMFRKNCVKLFLGDIKTNNYVKFSRFPDGFNYIMNYDIDPKNNFTVIHYFSNHSERVDNGEIISIKQFINGNFSLDVRYNINQKKIGETYGKKSSITLEQKQFILEKLNEAIKCASSITIDKVKSREQKKNKRLIKKIITN